MTGIIRYSRGELDPRGNANEQNQTGLVSVSDKGGIVPFVEQLRRYDVEILSTGGTAAALRDRGIPVVPVDQVTGVPEMLGGRVKTLHPRLHGGILAQRDRPEQMADAAAHDLRLIDLVVVNLYRSKPWSETTGFPSTKRWTTSTLVELPCCAQPPRISLT